MKFRSTAPASLLAVTASLFLPFALATAETAPPDYRFHFEVLAEGLPQPMTMQEAPDGRIFFHEIAGKVKVFDPKTKLVSEIGEIAVTTAQENGLLGMALDPDFAKNGWIYFMHSPPDYDGQYISRFTLTDGKLDPATRKDLLNWPEQREQCCHHAGTLRFGPDGCLYISTGDNTNPFNDSEGYAPIDERPDRGPWDAQKSSANTNDLRGKVLRIKPTPEGGYTIPEGNLFPPGTPKTRPEIYAMGFRNPWRFNIDPKSGFVYVGDVGPDAGGDKEERGPRGYDTVNQVRQAGNYGWPYSRGNRVYVDFDFAAKMPGTLYDKAKPINRSPNNSGLTELPPVQAPLVWYPGGDSEDFPILGKGGRTACGGPVFHYDPAFEKTGGLPDYYDGCLLFYDWQRPFIHWARLDEEGKLIEILPFTGAARVAQGDDDGSGRFQIKRPVDFFFGRDGALYIMDYGETWGANADSRLVRMSYQRGNLAPVTKATISPTSGREPLQVTLSAAGSLDHEGDAIRHEWRLGDTVLSTDAEATVTLKEAGDFRIELVVTDDKGAVGRTNIPVTVGNSTPRVTFLSPRDGDFFTPGEPVSYRIAVSDPEDGDGKGREVEFSMRALISSAWAAGDGKLSDVDPGLSRMKQSDCFNCHAVDQKIVGPSLMDIAKRYQGQPGAVELSVERVIKGSTGVWSPLPMLPHPNHTADEVHMMVKWIYSLAGGQATPTVSRGMEGTIVPPKDNKLATGIVEATFTDLGRTPAGPLSGKAQVRLRTRRIEAEKADQLTGPRVQGKVIGSIAHGHTARIASVPLAEIGSIKVLASSGGSGGKIEVRSGAPDGPLLGTVDVPVTGGWDKFQEHQADLTPPTGTDRADLYLVFVNPGKGGLMNVDWVELGKPKKS
ncbi:MAG: PQQ-dependent sugar dehydrogenase [Verrucomicrobiales bacterium]|nr:PQQ-dependent sugar dehydrogenase [Verrucomicrobiales bacterium]